MKTDLSVFVLQIGGKCLSASLGFQNFLGGTTQTPPRNHGYGQHRHQWVKESITTNVHTIDH